MLFARSDYKFIILPREGLRRSSPSDLINRKKVYDGS
jgi:hypothetical protein